MDAFITDDAINRRLESKLSAVDERNIFHSISCVALSVALPALTDKGDTQYAVAAFTHPKHTLSKGMLWEQ